MRSLTCVVSEVSRDVMSPERVKHQCPSGIFVYLVIIKIVSVKVYCYDYLVPDLYTVQITES